MKKLVNHKTGEIAYVDMENNTIYFSNSKTTHHAIIATDENDKITKITALPVDDSESLPKPKKNSKPAVAKTDNAKSIAESNEPGIELQFNLDELIPEPEFIEFENDIEFISLNKLYRISA